MHQESGKGQADDCLKTGENVRVQLRERREPESIHGAALFPVEKAKLPVVVQRSFDKAGRLSREGYEERSASDPICVRRSVNLKRTRNSRVNRQFSSTADADDALPSILAGCPEDVTIEIAMLKRKKSLSTRSTEPTPAYYPTAQSRVQALT